MSWSAAPTSRRGPRAPSGFRFVANIVVALVRLMGWRIEVRGVEHVPSDGGAILAYNHHSYVDFVMVAWVVYRKMGRPLRFLAKRELFDSRWTRWGVRLAGAVPVDRAQGTERNRALAAAIEAAHGGDLVVVAPEQTISRSFELLPFRSGAIRMAQAAGVPLVPVVGWGTQRVATKGHRPQWLRHIPVLVEYGPPLEVPPDADAREATDALRETMTRMLHDVQDRYPDRPSPDEDPWWLPRRLDGTAPDHETVLAEHLARQRGWTPDDRREAS
jgi:1-acyl-sn-glycerol-3-phosphate acyltransferase